MTNGKRMDVSPLLEIMTNDVQMLNKLFNDLENIKAGYYQEKENLAVLRKITKALSLGNFTPPKNQDDFSDMVGDCEREILKRTGQIRRDTMALIKTITKEEIKIGETKEVETKEESKFKL